VGTRKAGGKLNFIDGGSCVFRQTKYLAVGSVSAGLFFALLAITSNIIVLQAWELNPFAEPLHIVMDGLIAALFGANIAVLLHNSDKKSAGSGETQMTTLGGFAALLTSSCPLCSPFLLFSVGLGGFGAFMAGVSALIAIASITLLSFSLKRGLEAADGTCGIRRR
jgi:hypothetical protein